MTPTHGVEDEKLRKKSDRGNTPFDIIEREVDMVLKEGRKITSVGKQFNIPRRSLRRYIDNQKNNLSTIGIENTAEEGRPNPRWTFRGHTLLGNNSPARGPQSTDELITWFIAYLLVQATRPEPVVFFWFLSFKHCIAIQGAIGDSCLNDSFETSNNTVRITLKIATHHLAHCAEKHLDRVA
uniref:HTH psq-type domain-containing protein n=1 Tax=Daphnia galeata TaxID=27404 RepID=A0A8J2WQR9_9CRUS|nr:unnamed protein product [Daphnia galeata]